MDYLKSLDSNSELASVLSYFELMMGDYHYFSNYLSMIDKLTAADIQTAAVKYLSAENRTIAVLNREINKNTNACNNEK